WLVDVILSFEQDVASDSFGVYGKFGTVNTAFSWPANTAAGETASLFTLLGAAGTVKYQDLVDTIAAVNVGAFNLSAANLNNTMKIQLVIWDPALDPAQDPTVRKVLAETTYQFTDIQTVTEPQTHSMTVSASSYTVSENGAPATEQQTTSNWFNRPEGTTFDLSYTGEDEFHSWINESNNIVSTEKDYSVTLVRDTSLSAVSTGTYEDETEPTAFVIIKNAYKQIQASGRVTEFTINQLFSESGIPGKMGYDFDKWVFDGTEDEATVDAIAAKLSNTEEVTITIVPHYIQRQDTYVVTIQVIDQQAQETFTDDSLNEELNIGSRKDYVLSEVLDVFGKDVSEFSYWSMDGGVTPASYDANKFTVISTKDDVAVTIVLNAPTVEPSAFIAITQQYTSQANEKYIISTTMKFYVPDTDTVHESGFVYGLDGEKFGGQNAEDNLQIGKEGVSKHVAPSMTNDVIYTYNLRTSNPTGKTLYIRGFLIYEDTDGIHTIYTDVYSKAFLD
ncbi:MAG: hypothetical protein IK088_08500, partial [Lachnospiraceae bacterium]|nr:hypothetical protein [Lachnospiraceae bacterium]